MKQKEIPEIKFHRKICLIMLLDYLLDVCIVFKRNNFLLKIYDRERMENRRGKIH